MMRIIGILSTAVLIFVVGFGTGGYTTAKYAYYVGAKAAYIRCARDQVGSETADYRRIRCGAALLFSDGLDGQ